MMTCRNLRLVCLLIVMSVVMISVGYAFIYETKQQSMSQTIIRSWLSGWANRAKISIDHNSVSSDLTNFPVLLHLSSSSGVNGQDMTYVFSKIGSNSQKIAVTTILNTTQCYAEIEKWVFPFPSVNETLRPNAVGDTTQVSSVYPAGTPHWQVVNDSTADDDTDYIYTASTSSSYQTDLYNLPDHTASGTISSVTVSFRFRSSSTLATAYARSAIKTYGTIYNGTAASSTSTTYSTRSYTWTTNPNTGLSWTWSEIDTLQVGVGLRISSSSYSLRCTQVYIEVTYVPPGGEAWIWAKVPSISSSADTELYLYYDNNHSNNTNYIGDVGSTPGQNVWDSNYKGVWHLKEDPTTTAPQMKDSTSNNNRGTSAGTMTSGNQVTGQIDGSLSFDGSNDEITCGNAASLQITAALTIEAWAKTSSTGAIYGIVNKQVDASYNGYQLRKHSDNRYRFAVGSPATYYATSDVAYTDSNWHYIVGVKSTTNYLFVDGAQQTSTFTNAITDSGANFDIGRSYSSYNGYWWNGQIDEVRVSNFARSAAWLRASYESGRDHLVIFESEQIY
jgi:hypothetical protein